MTKIKMPTNYAKNVAKSLMFASLDVAKNDLMPNVGEFAEDNKAFFSATYATLRNPKAAVRQQINAFKDSKVYTAIDYGSKNLFEDLRTGNFYNKEREDRDTLKFSGLNVDDFNDLSEFGIDDDWESNIGKEENDVVTLGDKKVVNAIESSSAAATSTTVNAIAAASDRSIKNSRVNTGILYEQNERLFGGIHNDLSVLNATMDAMLRTTSTSVANIDKNSAGYFTEALKLDTERNAILKEMLELQRNQYKTAIEKQQELNGNKKNKKRRWSDITSNGLPNFEDYAELIKDRIIDEVGSMGVSGFNEDSNMLAAYMTSPLKGLTTGLVKGLIPATLKVATKEFDQMLTNTFGTVMARMVNERGKDGSILGILGKFLGVNASVERSINSSKYFKGPVPFDGLTRKAIVDVIPTYLRRIEAALTGREESMYDYDNGKWTTARQVDKDFKQIKKNYVRSSTSELRSAMNPYIKSVVSKNADDSESLEKAYDEFWEYLYEVNGDFNPKKSASSNGISAVNYPNLYKHYKIVATTFSEFGKGDIRNKDRVTNLSTRMVSSRILSAKDSENKQYRDIEQSVSSVFSQYFGSPKTDVHGKFYTDYNGKETFKANHQLLQVKDSEGNNIFDYLRMMSKELIWQREYGFGFGGKGSGGGNNTFNPSMTRDQLNSIVITNAGKRSEDSSKSRNMTTRNNEAERKALEKINKGEAVDLRDFSSDEQKALLNLSDLIRKQSIDEYAERVNGLVDEGTITKFLDKHIFKTKVKTVKDLEKIIKDADKEGKNTDEIVLDDESESNFVKSIMQKFKKGKDYIADIASAPFEVFENVLYTADRAIYDMLFKAELRDDEDDDHKEYKGVLDMLSHKINDKFKDIADKFKEDVLDPLREKLGLGEGEFGERFKAESKRLGKSALERIINANKEVYTPLYREIFGDVTETKRFNDRKDARARAMQRLDFINNNKDLSSEELWKIANDYNIAISNYTGPNKLQDINKDLRSAIISTIISKTNNYKEISNINELDAILEGISNNDDLLKIIKDIEKSHNIKVSGSNDKELIQSLRAGLMRSSTLGSSTTGLKGELNNQFSLFNNNGISGQSKFNYALNNNIGSNEAVLESIRYIIGNTSFDDMDPYTRNALIAQINKMFLETKHSQVNDHLSSLGFGNDFASRKQALINELIKRGASQNEIDKASNLNDLRSVNNALGKLLGINNGFARGTFGKPFMGNTMLSKGELLFNNSGISMVNSTGAYSLNQPTHIMSSYDSYPLTNALGLNNGPRRTPNQDLAQENVMKNKLFRNAFGTIANHASGSDLKISGGIDSADLAEAADIAKKYLPEGAAGGVAGGILALLLGTVGGPLVGAALGAGASIISNSNELKDKLFGAKGEDGKRQGGKLFNKKIMDAINKYMPDTLKYAAAGIIPGLITPLGPLGGILIGGAIGALKNNERFTNRYFGEEGKLTLSNKTKDTISKMLPGAAKGAAVGSIAGVLFGGPFGLLGNAALGSAVGMMASTEDFKDMILGKEIDGKRYGGLVGELKQAVEPFKDLGIQVKDKLLGILDNQIAKPLKAFIEPAISRIPRVIGFFPSLLGKAFEGVFHRSFGDMLRQKFTEPIAKLASGLMNNKVINTVAKGLNPLNWIGGLGNRWRDRDIKNGKADYMSATDIVEWMTERGKSDKISKWDIARAGVEKGQNLSQAKELSDKMDLALNSSFTLQSDAKKKHKELTNIIRNYESSTGKKLDIKTQKYINNILNNPNGNSVEAISNILSRNNILKGGGNLSNDELKALQKELSDKVTSYQKANELYKRSTNIKDKDSIYNELKEKLEANGVKIKNRKDLIRYSASLKDSILYGENYNGAKNPENDAQVLAQNVSNELLTSVKSSLEDIVELMKMDMLGKSDHIKEFDRNAKDDIRNGKLVTRSKLKHNSNSVYSIIGKEKYNEAKKNGNLDSLTRSNDKSGGIYGLSYAITDGLIGIKQPNLITNQNITIRLLSILKNKGFKLPLEDEILSYLDNICSDINKAKRIDLEAFLKVLPKKFCSGRLLSKDDIDFMINNISAKNEFKNKTNSYIRAKLPLDNIKSFREMFNYDSLSIKQASIGNKLFNDMNASTNTPQPANAAFGTISNHGFGTTLLGLAGSAVRGITNLFKGKSEDNSSANPAAGILGALSSARNTIGGFFNDKGPISGNTDEVDKAGDGKDVVIMGDGTATKYKRDQDNSVTPDTADSTTKNYFNRMALKEKAQEKFQEISNNAMEKISALLPEKGEIAKKGLSIGGVLLGAALAAPALKKFFEGAVKPVWTNCIKPFFVDKVKPYITDQVLPTIKDSVKSLWEDYISPALVEFWDKKALPFLYEEVPSAIGWILGKSIRNLPHTLEKVLNGLFNGLTGYTPHKPTTVYKPETIDSDASKYAFNSYGGKNSSIHYASSDIKSNANSSTNSDSSDWDKKTNLYDEEGNQLSRNEALTVLQNGGTVTSDSGQVVELTEDGNGLTYNPTKDQQNADKHNYRNTMTNAVLHSVAQGTNGIGFKLSKKVSKISGKLLKSNSIIGKAAGFLGKGISEPQIIAGNASSWLGKYVGDTKALAELVAENGDEAYQLADNFAQKAGAKLINSKPGKLISKAGSNISKAVSNTSVGKKIAEVGSKTAKSGKNSAGLVSKLIKNAKEAIDKLLSNSKVLSKIKDVAEVLGKTDIGKFVTSLKGKLDDIFTEALEKGAKKAGTKAVASAASKLNIIATVAFIIKDFIWGCDQAESILGVTDTNVIEELVAGLVNALCNLLIIPAIFPGVNWCAQKLIEFFGKDLKERQAEADAEYEKYKEETGSTETKEEYLKNKYSATGKIGSKVKDGLSKAGKKIKEVTSKIGETVSNVASKVGSKILDMAGVSKDVMGYMISGDVAGLMGYNSGVEGTESADGSLSKATVSLFKLSAFFPTLLSAAVHKIADGVKFVVDKVKTIGGSAISTIWKMKDFTLSGDVSGLLGFKPIESDNKLANGTSKVVTYIGKSILLTPTLLSAGIHKVADGVKSVIDAGKNIASSVINVGSSLMSYVKSGDVEGLSSFNIGEGEGMMYTIGNVTANVAKIILTPAAYISKAAHNVKDAVQPIINEMSSSKEQSNDIISKAMKGEISIFSSQYWSSSGNGSIISKVYNLGRKFLYAPAILTTNIFSKVADAFDNVKDWLGEKFKGVKEFFEDPLAFVYKKITGNDTDSGSGTGSFVRQDSGSGKYGRGYKQIDPSIASIPFNVSGDTQRQTIGDSACGPAAAVEALHSVYGRGGSSEVVNAANYALRGGYKEINGGTKPRFFNDYFAANGVGSSTSYNRSQLRRNIMNGQPTVLMGQDKGGVNNRNPFGPNPHYVTVTGTDGRGNVIVQDPESKYDNQLYRMNDVINKSSLGVSVYGRSSSAFSKKMNNYFNRSLSKYGKSKYGRGIQADSNGLITGGRVINIPDGLGNVHTYMGWQLITSPSSNQYKLRETAGQNFDSEGFGIINGRYVIACTTTYGNVGDYVDFYQVDGLVIPTIIGDIKNTNDAGCNQWGHQNGNCIVEFVVDKNSWYNCGHPNPGNSGCHPEWNQNLTKAVNGGSYYDDPSFRGAGNGTYGDASSSGSDSSDETSTSGIFGQIQAAFDNSGIGKVYSALFGGTSSSEGESGGINNIGNASAQAVVQAAQGEVGYKEGSNNDTKYGQWYGMNNQPWCDMFVSWASAQAGVPESINPKSAYTVTHYDWFAKKGQTVSASEGQPGDLVFFTKGGPSGIYHVGISKGVQNGELYTIEGNHNDQVAESKYSVGDSRLLLARPAYSGGSSSSSFDTSGITDGGDDFSATGGNSDKPLSRYGMFSKNINGGGNNRSGYIPRKSPQKVYAKDSSGRKFKTESTSTIPKYGRSKYGMASGIDYSELFNVVINILIRIADNSDKLETIATILSNKLGSEITSSDLSNATKNSNNNSKSKLKQALTSINNQNTDSLSSILNAMNAIASE